MCIPIGKVCDKIQDCPDAEDEPLDKCGREECKLNNGGCSQLCQDTLVGFYCECRKGYKLASDNRTCEDINECEILGSCSQLCTNERGGFKVPFFFSFFFLFHCKLIFDVQFCENLRYIN
jgi:very low-density lipoprotein receptor